MADTWLDDLVGWKEEGNVIKTWWLEDPAIDQEASDFTAYAANLDKSCLVALPGKAPVDIIITLPTAAQWGNIQQHFHDVGLSTAAIITFQLCVRFPDIEKAKPTMVLGFRRLNEGFMRSLVKKFPTMVSVLGNWVMAKYLLSEDEKKTLLQESTQKTLLNKLTTAKAATKKGKPSKVAQIKDTSRKQKAVLSG